MLGDIAQYEYQPASDVESDEDVPIGKQYSTEEIEAVKNLQIADQVTAPTEQVPSEVAPAPSADPVETVAPEPEKPKKATPGQVQGFQLVQATGLTDTSTPAPKGSEIPNFATATPIPATPLPSQVSKPVSNQPLPAPAPEQRQLNPLEDYSKSKQFAQRTDV
jgi:hypothetical protein